MPRALGHAPRAPLLYGAPVSRTPHALTPRLEISIRRAVTIVPDRRLRDSYNNNNAVITLFCNTDSRELLDRFISRSASAADLRSLISLISSGTKSHTVATYNNLNENLFGIYLFNPFITSVGCIRRLLTYVFWSNRVLKST